MTVLTLLALVLVYAWGRSDGYKLAIGRPIPMAYLKKHFTGYFVPAPAKGLSPATIAALVEDRTGKNEPLYVAAEPGRCFPAEVDAGRDWRGRQVA